MKIHSHNRFRAGYTLIEALVAGVILMSGIAAAAQLTLILLSQEEMNRRTAVALNVQENAATLFRLGFEESEIIGLMPEDPVVDQLIITPGNYDLGGGLGNMDYAEVTVEYSPAPADEAWNDGLWTAGEVGGSVAHAMDVYRSIPPNNVE